LEDGYDLPFTVEGRPLGERPYHGDALWRPVGFGYFETLGIPLRRGRLFDERDTTGSAPVVLINEAMAKQHWPKEDPVGQRIVVGRGLGKEFEEPARQIVGVVADAREESIQQAPQPLMYIPMGQTTDGLIRLSNAVLPMSFLVKTVGRPQELVLAVEKEIRALDGQLALARVRSMEQVLADATARHNFNMQLLGIFASVAMVLAAVGIYGLMAYAVQQRTQEIGIRMALGAGRGDLLRLMLGQGALLAGIGVLIGVAGAFGLTRLMTRLLYGVQPTDVATFVTVAVLLSAVALGSTYLPARRATKVDPLVALRYE
jgi:predicted permease